ncbi:MAG: multidrug effflux MFS transporter [Steroidobacteraceae bacterium]|nr:multidrug effflux MFS transporter [Steroidobacteraceae bacterium]
MPQPSRFRRRLPGWLLLVAAMTALGPISIDMYLPGFPLIEAEFGQRGVESTMAAYLLGLTVGQVFYGPLSDRFGRKPPLYVGFVLYAIGSLGCALASTMGTLTLMRVAQALGGGAGMVISRAIVRDRSDVAEAARAFSTLLMIVALGPVVAPAVGGVVVTFFGWRATFLIQAVLGIALMIAMHVVLTETVERSQARTLSIVGVMRGYLRLLLDRRFIAYSLIGGFGMGALFSYVTGAPTVLTQRYDLSPQQFGWLIALNGFAFMTASRLNIVALRTMTPAAALARHVWTPTALSAALFVSSLLWPLPLWMVVVLQLSIFVSVGRLNPNVAALALAPHGQKAGAASALMGAIQSLISTIAGFAVGLFNDGTVATLAAVMMAGTACGLASYAAARS